jgi:hypothetical protein
MESPSPPVIVLQGDHGPPLRLLEEGPSPAAYRERLGILSAYLVPPAMGDDLYPSISPVNTFRVLFAELFGEELGALPDRSYFDWYAGSDIASELGGKRIDVTELLEVGSALVH